jgi:MOSC domain-containing protein YiiM
MAGIALEGTVVAVAANGTPPGQLGENITTAALQLERLPL